MLSPSAFSFGSQGLSSSVAEATGSGGGDGELGERWHHGLEHHERGHNKLEHHECVHHERGHHELGHHELEHHERVRHEHVTIMSDRLGKYELQLSQEFAREVAFIGVFCVALRCLDYVDAEYGLWLTWLLTPLLVTFLLPMLLILLMWASAVIFHVYRLYRLRLVDGANGDWRAAAKLIVCAIWDAHGWLWHGYEISGLQNIPDGPCLIIYYHGALPIDMYYFIARLYILKRCVLHTVADRLLFKIPGWSVMLEGLSVIPGTIQECINILRAGNKLSISPGGVYEAQFGDHRYELKWRDRVGFAKVAQAAKVPIVPMFTQNVREAFRTVGLLRWVWLRVYQAIRVPLAPVYGGFPVKLITHLGRPIPYDPTLTPQQLQRKVAKAIEDLIEEHQRVPGSILRGLTDRVYRVPKKQKKSQANGSCNGRTVRDTPSKSDVRDSEKFVERKNRLKPEIDTSKEEGLTMPTTVSPSTQADETQDCRRRETGSKTKVS